VFDADLSPLLEEGCALVAALVDADGEPRATRAWSVTVLSSDPPMVRVALQLGEVAGAGHDPSEPDVPIAVTGAMVRTLDSLQLKGRIVGIDPPTDEDLALIDVHLEGFATAVEEKDKIPRDLLEYIFPEEFEMVTIAVTDLFDQTPGPTAGNRLGGAAP
jgi:hypothetical protein